MWIAYSYSLYFSEQFSYINYFHLIYGLKVIKFTKGLNNNRIPRLSQNPETDMWVLPCQITILDNVLNNVDLNNKRNSRNDYKLIKTIEIHIF